MARRNAPGIVGPLAIVFVAGFAKSNRQVATGSAVTGGFDHLVTRIVGVTIAAVLLGAIGSNAPQVASGVAWLMAVTAMGYKAEAIGDTVGRMTNPTTTASAGRERERAGR